jgi:hypothetical protein
LIGLSPLGTAHPSCFQPTLVRTSTWCYPGFILAMPRSSRFAFTPSDYGRPIQTRFRYGYANCFASPLRVTSRLIMQKARGRAFPTRRRGIALPLLVDRRFQVLFHSPNRGSFHLSLTVLVRYRSQSSIQPWRMVPPDSHRVSRAPWYSGTRPEPVSLSPTGLSPSLVSRSMLFD